MALSLNANFIAAARKGTVKPRFLVELYVNSTTSYKFLSGKCDSVSYPESIVSLVPVTRSLDYLTRETSTSQSSITFIRDQMWDDLINDYAIKGGHVDIKIGFAELAEGDFEQHAALLVESVKFSETEVVLRCKTTERKLGDDEIFWQWISLHPLQVARRILFLSGVPNSRVDLTSLDPATYSSSISHFVCNRTQRGHGTNALANPPGKAKDMLSDIARILGGSFHDDENGKIKFTKFDPTASVVDSWTEDDIFDLVVEPVYENLVNKITVNTHPWVFSSGDKYTHSYTDEDSTSQSDHAIVVPGGTDQDNVKEFSIKTNWVGAIAQLYTDFTPSSPANGATFKIQSLSPYAFCGTAWGDIAHGPYGSSDDYFSSSNYPTGSQNAEHAVSSSRPIYVNIRDEIIKCTGLSIIESAIKWLRSPKIASNHSVKVPHRLELTIASTGGRGALGTSAGTHNGIDGGGTPNLVYDVTIQQHIADILLTRLKNGGQVIRCATGIDKFAVQRGDLVDITLPASRYRAKGKAGLDSSTKFEVTEKSLDIFAFPPRLQWTLVEAIWTGAPGGSYLESTRQLLPYDNLERFSAAMNADVGTPHVVTGFDVASTSGFDVTFNAGVASSVHGRAEATEQSTFTVNASKDTYFAMDTIIETISSYETTNGGAQPTKAPQEAWLTKVVSDGSAITSTDDTIRTTTAIAGQRLHDATVQPRQISGEQRLGRTLNLNGDFALRSARVP